MPTAASQTDLNALKTRVDILSKRTDLTRIPLDLDAVIVTVTSGASDAVFSAQHTLKRVPIGYMVVRAQGGAGEVYEPKACPAWTATSIFLAVRGDAGVRLTLLLY